MFEGELHHLDAIPRGRFAKCSLIGLSLSMSLYLSVCLFVCLSVCLSLSLSVLYI